MEQVEGGELMVNKGYESKPREKGSERNMNAVEGLETALRLAEVRLIHRLSYPFILTENLTGKHRRACQI